MNKCKYIVWILIFTILSTFSYPVWAENSDITKLYSEKQEYIKKCAIDWFQGEDFADHPFVPGVTLTVLLYTDVAQELTFIKHEKEGFLLPGESWFCGLDNYYISSPEIDTAINVSKYNGWRVEHSSHLRACIQYFDISKEELIVANQKMQEDAEGKVLRSLFPFLTDSEFETARKHNGLYYLEPIADFMIEALYLEDDVVANNLLCKPYAVYVKELGETVVIKELELGAITVKEFAQFDLTSDWMGDFIDECADDLSKADYEYLYSAREAQLKASQTGDGAVSALWAVAVAIPALAFVTIKRKRRI